MKKIRRTLIKEGAPIEISKKKKVTIKKVDREVTYGCNACGLSEGCRSPKIKGMGACEGGVMIIAESPGVEEDARNKSLVRQSKSGSLIYKAIENVGWNLDNDIYRTNVVHCHPPNNDLGSIALRKLRIESCKKNLEKEIFDVDPDVIILLGNTALEAVLGKTGVKRYRGFMIPSKKYNCIVCPTYHPAFFMHGEGDLDRSPIKKLWDNDIKKFLTEGFDRYDKLEELLDWHEDENNYNLVTFDDTIETLKQLSNEDILAVDFETNGIKSYLIDDPKILCCSFTTEDGFSFCVPIHKGNYWTIDEKREIINRVGAILESKFIKKVIQNAQFEAMWTETLGSTLHNVTADTMIDAHLLDCRGSSRGSSKEKRASVTSLDFQVFTNYGFEYKGMVDHADLINADDEILFKYNNLDTKFTMRLYNDRQDRLKTMQIGRDLFVDGQMIFGRWERKGVSIDVEELNRQDKQIIDTVDILKETIMSSKAVLQFRSKYNKEPNIGDNATTNDVKKIMFDILKVDVIKKTAKGNPSLAGDALLEYAKDIPFCADLVELRKLNHHRATYLTGIKKLVHNGMVHPSANLHFVSTYRSSYSNPNLQNQPKKSDQFKEVRKIVLPDEGHIIGEVDYSGIEVRVAAMMSKDPVLVKYLNSGYDMHREWASKVFKMEEVSDEIRSITKNMFVFPEFYGSYYKTELTSLEQVPEFIKAFSKDGYYSQTNAEAHLKRCEDEFWNTFSVFKKWQNKQHRFYDKHGYVETFWGFRRYAPLSMNMVINAPIQGQAFHLLLWSIIQIEKMEEWKQMESRIMFEVHDANVISIEPSEKERVVELVTDVMTNLPFDFINVPIDVEWEFSTLEKPSWYDMKKK